MKASFVGALSFVAGVVLSVVVYSSFPQKEPVVVEQVKYDETQIIKNMIAEFDELPGDPWASFSLSYYPSRRDSSPTFYVNVDYGNVTHKETFSSYEEFISYISSPEKYHTRVIEVSR